MNVIQEMLTENTGRHMLDSGGAYGRNWERNQGRDFEAEPATTLDVTWNREGEAFDPCVTHNVYHWLNERVTFDPDMNARWLAYLEENNADADSFAAMEEFAESLDATGIYGDGSPMTVNTYNGESSLSQILQFTYFEVDGDVYVLLQIHGGCDARGGYTDAKAFRADENLFDYAQASIYADGEGSFDQLPYWYSDDGWNWYCEGAVAPHAGKGLRDYIVSFDPAHKGDGEHVYIDEDANTAYCPMSGLPLRAST